ncbi:hypothetical protein [Vibrio sp. VB16]|uniref:hypothetical protein n=1 Tax=Vibrio sp. VB16 TaxID=2785746 RepID=UPI00189DFF46|nr:hypothetical protein [Vibrio sp. VB16]UGA55292.1 hypothetical protein IUZ65_002770 [Vibrio sp. VB16]
MLGSLAGGMTGGAGGMTGGASGDIYTTNTNDTTNNSGFTGGTYNFGSNNGVPSWAIVAIGLGVLWFFFKK